MEISEIQKCTENGKNILERSCGSRNRETNKQKIEKDTIGTNHGE